MWEERIPDAVRAALCRLEKHGFESVLVGGCVRDLLRGTPIHDFDITTSALPEQTSRIFADKKVVETGIKHGTVTVFFDHIPLEITTFRTDGAYSDGRHPDEVRFTRSLQEDLARRDFTVNAMAWSPLRGLTDPFGGRADLENHILRCVGNPKTRFEEDALRILRGMRFASTLGFALEEETKKEIFDCKELLRRISSERIREELVKLLCGEHAFAVADEYREILAFVLPELEPCFGFDQKTPHHCYDVYTHTLHVLQGVPNEPILRIAAFFHDIAKPQTYAFYGGRGHFKRHPERSAETAEAILRRLHTDKETIRAVCTLIRWHDIAIDGGEHRAIKFLQEVPEEWVDAELALMRADANAKADPAASLAQIDAFQAELNEVRNKNLCLRLCDLALTGDDLRSMGIPEGKAVGAILRSLLDDVAKERLPNRKDVLAEAALQRAFGDGFSC